VVVGATVTAGRGQDRSGGRDGYKDGRGKSGCRGSEVGGFSHCNRSRLSQIKQFDYSGGVSLCLTVEVAVPYEDSTVLVVAPLAMFSAIFPFYKSATDMPFS
jgi:hypothetical protein